MPQPAHTPASRSTLAKRSHEQEDDGSHKRLRGAGYSPSFLQHPGFSADRSTYPTHDTTQHLYPNRVPDTPSEPELYVAAGSAYSSLQVTDNGRSGPTLRLPNGSLDWVPAASMQTHPAAANSYAGASPYNQKHNRLPYNHYLNPTTNYMSGQMHNVREPASQPHAPARLSDGVPKQVVPSGLRQHALSDVTYPAQSQQNLAIYAAQMAQNHFLPSQIPPRPRAHRVSASPTQTLAAPPLAHAEHRHQGDSMLAQVVLPAQSSVEHVQKSDLKRQQQWLQTARPILQGAQAFIFPQITHVSGIPPTSSLPVGKADLVLSPQMIWGLRSLTPAQRYNAYISMVEYGRRWMNEGEHGPNHEVYWQLITELSDRLKKKENEWYATFTNGHPSTMHGRQARFQDVVRRQTLDTIVTRAEIELVVQAEDESAHGHPQQDDPHMSSLRPQQGFNKPYTRGSIDNPISLDNETSSPRSNLTAAGSNDPQSDTPLTAVSSEDSPLSPNRSPAQETQSLVEGKKRPSEISEEEEEDEKQRAAKKARVGERTNPEKRRYEEIQDDVDAWWKSKGNDPKDVWWVKLNAWDIMKGTAVPSVQQPKQQKTSAQQTALKHRDNGPQVSSNTTTSPDMTSSAEIKLIRQQWGGSKPDARKHPLDKVPVPQYPQEDTVENSHQRPDGQYYCKHVNRNEPCCNNGLDHVAKKRSTQKDVTNFKKAVEQLVVSGDLHVAHKTWDRWHNKKITAAQRVAQIDAILRAVQNLPQLVPAPAPPTAVQHIQQQQGPRQAKTVDPVPAPIFANVPQPHERRSTPNAEVLAPTGVPAVIRVPVQAAPRLPVEVRQPEVISPQLLVGKSTLAPHTPATTKTSREQSVVTSSVAARAAKAASAAPKTGPNPDHQFRQAAMIAIHSQMKQVEPVFVGGIDLSKEPIRLGGNRVIDKVVRALKLQAAEDVAKVSPVPEVMKDPLDVGTATPDEGAESLAAENTVGDPAEKCTAEQLGMPEIPEIDASLSSEIANEALLFSLIDRIPEDFWKQTCTWSIDDLKSDDVLDLDQEPGSEPDHQMTLAEEHARWIFAHHDTPVAACEGPTSFDDFDFAMKTFDEWNA